RTRHALGAVAREVAIEKGRPVPEKSEAGLPLPLDKSIYISVQPLALSPAHRETKAIERYRFRLHLFQLAIASPHP
ncbi:MAG: hypothetical protein LIV26_10945, partial [Atopobium sp.]|nr:hypothetical protein [Atopobium sp.]